MPLSASESRSSRASERERWEPRLLPATAWISSTMTVPAVLSTSLLRAAVSRMNSDSGVVTRMWGGRLISFRRSDAGVSPVRTAVRMGWRATPRFRPARESRPAALRDSWRCRC